MTFIVRLVHCNNYIQSFLLNYILPEQWICPSNNNVTVHVKVKGQVINSVLETASIRLCCVLEVEDSNKNQSSTQPEATETLFATLIILCMVWLFVSIDRWILWEWPQIAYGLRGLVRFQWDLVVRPSCMHADLTHLLLQAVDLPYELSSGMTRQARGEAVLSLCPNNQQSGRERSWERKTLCRCEFMHLYFQLQCVYSVCITTAR